MSIFKREPQTVIMPKDVSVPMPAELQPEITDYAPKGRTSGVQQVLNTEGHSDAITQGIAALNNLRRDHLDLQAKLQDLTVDFKTKDAECMMLRLELAQCKTDLAISRNAEAEAYRERDNVINRLRTIATQIVDIDFGPPPTPRKRKKNGDHPVQTAVEEPTPQLGEQSEPNHAEVSQVPSSS